jgi:hypothetical protein
MAHVGHLHGALGLNDVDVQMQCRIRHQGWLPWVYDGYDTQVAGIEVEGDAMQELTQVVDTADAGFFGPYSLVVEFTITANAVDPEHPLGLLGIRLTDE